VGSCFEPDIEQLHVDGNKSLIYSSINYSLKKQDETFETKGRVAYVHNKGFISDKASDIAPEAKKWRDLPQQKPIEDAKLDQSNDFIYEFEVEGPPKVYNGGIEAVITCTNVQGVGTCSRGQSNIEKKGEAEHPGEETNDEEWETINSYNGGSDPYLQTGQALHVNYPEPGLYRIRVESGQVGFQYDADIRFLDEAAWPDPGQMAFKATSMRFWKMLRTYSKPKVSKLTIQQILKTRKWQRKYDTIVITNRVYPKIGKKLKKWVAKHDGNLVLTDSGLQMLWNGLGMIPRIVGEEALSVQKVGVYAGYVNFANLKKPVTYDDPLAKKIDQKGAAEGRSCAAKQSGIVRAEACQETDILHRRQTYEPVPLGYSLNEGGSPIWYVLAEAYRKAKGKQRAVATGQAQDEVTVGEIRWHGGRIRFVGALLPDPTKKYYHPYGLADYSLTWAGYQVLQNLVTWK